MLYFREIFEFLVAVLRLAERLEIVDPVQTDTLALHRLGTPQHGLWNLAVEERAKGVLLGFGFALDPLVLWINLHHRVDDVWVEEWHARLEPVRHGHAIGALAVDVV